MNENVRRKVGEFIEQNFYVGASGAFPTDASFLDNGVVDSTGILEIIDFLERTFAVKVADAEIIPENLDSIDRITAFVQRKRSGPGAAASP